MSLGKVLLGVLAGVSAGVMLGILFAPEKGSVMRKIISNKGEEYVDELEKKFNEFIDGIAQKIDTAIDNSPQLSEKGKLNVEEAKEKVADTTK
jgi:gas vesicle protein